MLTAIAGDDLATARRRAAARSTAEAGRSSSSYDLLDHLADLTHAAEAAAHRLARAS